MTALGTSTATPQLRAWAASQTLAHATPQAAGRRTVFVVQGGTLIEPLADNVDPKRLRFIPGAAAAFAALAEAAYALVVVSNQGGLALGRFTRTQYAALQAALQRRLSEDAGVAVLDFVTCPHAPGPGGTPACLCRTPAPGLLRRAARMHGLDLTSSWVVGDTLNDVEAGRRAGCRTALLDTGSETAWRSSPLRQPHVLCVDWPTTVNAIVRSEHLGLSASLHG